jgi:serine phosphatase RsbU (regulator of sigma subunit)
MAEDLTGSAAAGVPEHPGTPEPSEASGDQASLITGVGYQVVLGTLTVALLLLRTDLGRLSIDEGLLFLVLLLVSIACEELGFTLGGDVTVDLGGLFNGTAVLTLGFNGVWVPVLASLYWLLRVEGRRWRAAPAMAQLGQHLFNLAMNALPLWLALFAYQDLLGGELPLADLGANLLPALAFVLVDWLVLLAGILVLVLIARRGVRGAAQWLRGILAGFALTLFVPVLFSPAVAVILNRLGLGFFLFIAAGLLGISLMARRLALSLASERQRVVELTALNALGDDILHSVPEEAASGDLFLRHAPRFLPEADLQLCLFDPGAPEQRQVLADWRDGATQPGGDAPLTGPWVWLRQGRHPLLVTDSGREPLPFAWDEGQDGPRPGSLLLVPLLAADPNTPEAERCIGGIQMSQPQPGAFSPEALPSVTALAHQLAAALENARLHQEALAHERLERELALARGIQTSFLPADVPHIAGWSFVASLEPARHVSGDFYDFIPLPGGRWGILIADVADKGMPAALYMALARTLIRAHAPDHARDPAACLRAANDQILADTQSDLFVTVFYGILDPATGDMVFGNAGHCPPLLWHRDGRPAERLRNTGMALGVVPGVPLEDERAAFGPGDYLVLYTDGVTEAHDRDLKAFGDERLRTAALSAPLATGSALAAAIHQQILVAVEAFVGGAPQFDDLTLMVVGREGAKGMEPT